MTARRVLELSGAQFTRQAVRGLEIFLAAADDPASAEATRRLAATFADQPQAAIHLMEVLAVLEPAQARHLMTGTISTSADLSSFLSRISSYTPEQQRGILALLAEANLVARPPGPGSTAAEIVYRQLEGALQVQAEAARRTADQLRRQAQGLLEEALAADRAGLQRRSDALLAEAARREAQAAEAAGLADELAGREVTAGSPSRVGDIPIDLPGDDPVALGDELDAALSALEAGTGTRQQGVWIQLSARQPGPEQARALSRLMFTSRSGNPVVFRIEGGTGDVAQRSREYISIDASGRTRIRTGGNKLNLNIGSFERAVEFILEARPGARLKMFEIDAGYLRNLRSAITPEQGAPTLLAPVDASGVPVPGATDGYTRSDLRRPGRGALRAHPSSRRSAPARRPHRGRAERPRDARDGARARVRCSHPDREGYAMRFVVHPPTLFTPSTSGAGRVGAVVLAAVRAELLRLDAGTAGDRAGNDAAGRQDAGSDRTESAAGPSPEPAA